MAKRRILRYAAKHNALPAAISGTEEIPGHDSSAKDAWGHDLLYTVTPDGDVTLISLGKDNKPGGSGDNADMVGIFASRTPNGKWSAELLEWKLDPLAGLNKQ